MSTFFADYEYDFAGVLLFEMSLQITKCSRYGDLFYVWGWNTY